MDVIYQVKQMKRKSRIEVEVPGSKSITNRALLLAALSDGECELSGVLFSDDSRAFLSCLISLGFEVKIEEEIKRVMVRGMGGSIPNRQAEIDVRSAGTAARFLTVMLAFAGGTYILQSSEQMKKRPMEPLLTVLREAGVKIKCLEQEGHFPFQMQSDGIRKNEMEIDTNLSSQFASALLMAGVLLPGGLTLKMSGDRMEGAYIRITQKMMEQFGIKVEKTGSECFIPGKCAYHRDEYAIEPDVSGACYFYAMAPLLQTDVLVKNVHLNSLQGDIKFLKIIEELGCTFSDTESGIRLNGFDCQTYNGVTVDMKDFSDQTMTLAAIAPFAETPTLIKNVGHIRFQESDRISAIVNELTRLGIVCEEVPEEAGIRILPGKVKPAAVETYEDHRMAMAFTLTGLRAAGIQIINPSCCAKTFENYFTIIEEITQ